MFYRWSRTIATPIFFVEVGIGEVDLGEIEQLFDLAASGGQLSAARSGKPKPGIQPLEPLHPV